MMFKKTAVSLVAASLVMVTSFSGAMSASADTQLMDFTEAVSSVAPASLEQLAPIDDRSELGGNITSHVADIEIQLPSSSGTPIKYTNDASFEISIGLPLASRDSSALLDSAGQVTYADDLTVTAPLIKEDGSIAITTVIESSNAPTQFHYPVTLPEASQMKLMADGSIEIIDASGTTQAMVAKPWAVDASGKAIKTHFTISGTGITQTVEHQENGMTYPVVFDPWLGQYLISKIVWDFSAAALAAFGPTLRVYPTEFGRYTGILARDAAWDEVLKLAGSRANKQNMVDQFMCHWDYVRVSDPRKVSWNLDSARPNVGFWPTVWANCNPV